MNPIEDDTDSDSLWDQAVDTARCIPHPDVQLAVCLYDIFCNLIEED